DAPGRAALEPVFDEGAAAGLPDEGRCRGDPEGAAGREQGAQAAGHGGRVEDRRGGGRGARDRRHGDPPAAPAITRERSPALGARRGTTTAFFSHASTSHRLL